MPPAVAIPVALAGASLLATNVNNKAAIKNNETQQASAVGNTQQAYQKAQNTLNPWLSPNASPASGAQPGRPEGLAANIAQPQRVNASSLLSGLSQPAAGSQSPMLQQLIARLAGGTSGLGSGSRGML